MFRPMAHHDGVRAVRRARLLGRLLPCPARRSSFRPPKATARGGSARSGTRTRARCRRAIASNGCSSAAPRSRSVASFVLLARGGADFVPRIDEGDTVVTIRRAPSIGLAEAKELDLAAEKVLRRFPEVRHVARHDRPRRGRHRSGRQRQHRHLRAPAAAEEWTTAHDLDDLSESSRTRSRSEVAGTFVSVSQPIEDKTNELISGSRADVQIAIFGEELERAEAAERGRRRGRTRRSRRGRRPRRARSRRARASRSRRIAYGSRATASRPRMRFRSCAAARDGVPVGYIYEGQQTLRASSGHAASLADARGARRALRRGAGRHARCRSPRSPPSRSPRDPSQVRREDLDAHGARRGQPARARSRLVGRRGAAEGGRSKSSFRAGYRIEWGGQFENFERAKKRLALVVPMALAIIFGMLLWMFQSGALRGCGVRGRALRAHRRHARPRAARACRSASRRRSASSRSAASSVLNGVVHGQRGEDASIESGWPLDEAIRDGVDAHHARGSHHRRGRGVRLLAHGDRDRRGRRGAAAARNGGHQRASSSRPCSRCSCCPGFSSSCSYAPKARATVARIDDVDAGNAARMKS